MTKASRIIYLVAAWLFLTGITVQVFLAGMVVVAGQMGWTNHRDLGHGLGLPLLVMVVTAYLGRVPGSVKRMTWLLFAIYIIQADVVIFLRGSAPVIAALHPVLALLDFALAFALAKRAWTLARQENAAMRVEPHMEPAAGD